MLTLVMLVLENNLFCITLIKHFLQYHCIKLFRECNKKIRHDLMINYINNNVYSTLECQAVIGVLRWQTYRRRHNCDTQPCHSAITPLSRPVI